MKLPGRLGMGIAALAITVTGAATLASGSEHSATAHSGLAQATVTTLQPVVPGMELSTNAPTSTSTASASGTPVRPTPVSTGLEKPTHGHAAVEALGAALPAVAEKAGLSSVELTGVLDSDPTAWVSPAGRVFYKEEVPTAPTQASSFVADPTDTPYPLADTFTLHSLKGSKHTIFLDFDGVDLSSTTGWAADDDLAAGPYGGWDPAGDGSTFNNQEEAAVQEIWARVAEDYSAFDVDVTTEDPGDAALERTSTGDQTFGTRVVVTDSQLPMLVICDNPATRALDGECGGVAWTGLIDLPTSEMSAAQCGAADCNQIAWVFPSALSDIPSSIAEAAAHEAGHTFGLVHDGDSTTGDSYYAPGESDWSKARVWAPIMGASYYNAVSQWSKGSYPGATNWSDGERIALQDDVAIIRSIAGTRSTETGTLAKPLEVDGATRYITASNAAAYYSLGSCAAGATVSTDVARIGPDLDVDLTIAVAGSGAPVQSADPTTTQSLDQATWTPVTTGQGSSVTLDSAGGPYVAIVRGGGNLGGNWASGGYDGYASLGAYSLTVAGCDAAGDQAAQVRGLSAAVTPRSGQISVSWKAPAKDTVSSYDVVLRRGSTLVAEHDGLTPSATSATFTGLPAATYWVMVIAHSDAGTSTTAVSTVLPAYVVPRVPSAPRAGIRAGHKGGRKTVVLSWAPGSAGTKPVTGYQLTVYAIRKHRATVARRLAVRASVRATELALKARKGVTYAVAVQARNAVGWSPLSARTKAVTPK
ncbi:fibronectin type III domain-containing protein [Nocardioides sp. Kera G14]|uniref:fibronectin type III domain-containing protein n=1 Tax=Nocardioides sp. Kera G14 TaxID=2884264 RepID=UPI001D12DD39|nr:fibronectin type III domain-containing protein [Nocardioides sp. Kera G14]UDY23250.1 fibronectin type III domain-containing protein [Nocardioides sp. Kera G14]